MVHLCSSKVHVGGLANFTAIEKCWPTKQAKANIENCRFLVVAQARLPQFFKVADAVPGKLVSLSTSI